MLDFSVSVEDDQYLLTVLRYIHQNPIKAGITKKDEYLYTSYFEYLEGKSKISDVEFILEIIGKNEFVKFKKKKMMISVWNMIIPIIEYQISMQRK